MTETVGVIEVLAKDLPLHCPPKGNALWCSHPRVFLDILATGEAVCPYCGAHYKLKEGESVSTH